MAEAEYPAPRRAKEIATGTAAVPRVEMLNAEKNSKKLWSRSKSRKFRLGIDVASAPSVSGPLETAGGSGIGTIGGIKLRSRGQESGKPTSELAQVAQTGLKLRHKLAAPESMAATNGTAPHGRTVTRR
jgi:hypothetical protein